MEGVGVAFESSWQDLIRGGVTLSVEGLVGGWGGMCEVSERRE